MRARRDTILHRRAIANEVGRARAHNTTRMRARISKIKKHPMK